MGGLGRFRDGGGVVCSAREGRRDRVPRLRDRNAPRAWHGAGAGWRGSRRARARARAAAVILNQTPFYAEAGGQVGDTGVDDRPRACELRVTDTQKKASDLFVHSVVVEKGKLARNAALALEVDHARRTPIRQNHSATHLLHEALREVLGRSRGAEGLAGRTRSAALRFLASQADDARGDRTRRGYRQRRRAAERAGDDPAHGGR